MCVCVKDQCCQVALSPSCQVAMLQRGKVATWLQTDIRTDGCTYGRTDIHTDKLASWAAVAAKNRIQDHLFWMILYTIQFRVWSISFWPVLLGCHWHKWSALVVSWCSLVVIIKSLFFLWSSFLIEGVIGLKTLFIESGQECPDPVSHFWGPLAAILDLTGGRQWAIAPCVFLTLF